MQRINPKSLRRLARRLLGRHEPNRLRPHPYAEQFQPDMDCPQVDWAKRFLLIASTPRSGSHYLGHMLSDTGQCGVPLEYLNAWNAQYWAERFGVEGIAGVFPHLVKHRTTPNGTFTLKAHWSHFEPLQSNIDAMTRGIGIGRILWIVRRDLAAQAISFTIAEQTGAWISGSTVRRDPVYEYDTILDAARTLLKANENWRDYLASQPSETWQMVILEDLMQGGAARDRLQSFLDLDVAVQASGRTRKQGDSVNADWKARLTHELRDQDRWVLDPVDQILTQTAAP